MKKIFLVLTFFIFTNSANAADKQISELNNLFAQLKALSNLEEAKKVEDKIWQLWTTHPSEDTLTELLAKGSEYMMKNQLTSAHNVFSKVIELDPKWAEGWNKRATVLYMMGNFELSQKDIDMVLSLEKDTSVHFLVKDLFKQRLKIMKKQLIVISRHTKFIHHHSLLCK